MSKKANAASDLVTYAMMVAGITVLTRPGSNAAKQISTLGDSYARIIRTATGTDEVESQLRLFESDYMREPDRLPELEAELDRRIGLTRERHHRSWFDAVLGHNKVRAKRP
jgi:hypothetical protein